MNNLFDILGAEQLVVEPGQHRQYEVTYQPLTMTTENRKHNVSFVSSLFHRFPWSWNVSLWNEMKHGNSDIDKWVNK